MSHRSMTIIHDARRIIRLHAEENPFITEQVLSELETQLLFVYLDPETRSAVAYQAKFELDRLDAIR